MATIDKTKNKGESRPGKKCKSCGLDCIIVRGLAVAGLPDSKKPEKLKAMYGDTKPAYNPENCKKR